MKEAQIFENWINNLAEGTWALPETPEQQNRLKELMSQPLEAGPDGTNATEQLYDLVGDDQLFDLIGDQAEQDPNANIWENPAIMDRLSELGVDVPQSNTPDAEAQDDYYDLPQPNGDYDDLNEGVLTDSTGSTLDHICDRFGKEVRDFEATGDMSDDLFHALYDYYFDDMPYGTKKARDGDPYEWVADRFAQDRGVSENLVSPMAMPVTTEGSSCNMTAEGEYCPEHGLAECGSMYEMGTVTGGMAPVMGEGNDDPMNYNAAITGSYYESDELARIKSLALLK